MLSVVDEALELAQCRLVDLDAAQRVPALLPAIYLDEYNDSDLDIHHLLSTANQFPARWVEGDKERHDDGPFSHPSRAGLPWRRPWAGPGGHGPGSALDARTTSCSSASWPAPMRAPRRKSHSNRPKRGSTVGSRQGGAVLAYSPQSDVVEALVAGEAAGPSHSTLDRLKAGKSACRGGFLGGGGSAAHCLSAAGRWRFAETAGAREHPSSPTGWPSRRRSSALLAGSDAALGATLKLQTADATAARPDLAEFARWCAFTFGTGPSSWAPERFERRFELAIAGSPVLTAPGHDRERVDWHDFDAVPAAAGQSRSSTAKTTSRTRVPTNISFPGQPRDRFWEFEDATLSLARIDVTSSDLSRLALVEFSTLYGNDWFTFPIPVTYGSLQLVADLVVRDTFGIHELIAPAADEQWAIYRAAGALLGSPTLVVPSVTASPLAGDVVEEVSFLRDDVASLVWAVEQIVTDPDGTQHDLQQEYLLSVVRASDVKANTDVAYRLMTDVPAHWVPFIPVRLAGSSRQVGLVEAVLPRPDSFGDLVSAAPRSSVLQELKELVVPEEEVPAARASS